MEELAPIGEEGFERTNGQKKRRKQTATRVAYRNFAQDDRLFR